MGGLKIGVCEAPGLEPMMNQPQPVTPSVPDEAADLAHALAATKRLARCQRLPNYVHQAAEAFADLLVLYAPERALRPVPSVPPEAAQSQATQQPPLLR